MDTLHLLKQKAKSFASLDDDDDDDVLEASTSSSTPVYDSSLDKEPSYPYQNVRFYYHSNMSWQRPLFMNFHFCE